MWIEPIIKMVNVHQCSTMFNVHGINVHQFSMFMGYIYIWGIYIYIYLCVYVCVCGYSGRASARHLCQGASFGKSLVMGTLARAASVRSRGVDQPKDDPPRMIRAYSISDSRLIDNNINKHDMGESIEAFTILIHLGSRPPDSISSAQSHTGRMMV